MPTPESKAALLRFCVAVENGKRPAAADARLAAAFVREAIGTPRGMFRPKPQGRGRPGPRNKSYREFLNGPELDVVVAVARRIGNRKPEPKDFAAVGDDKGKTSRTVKRYWDRYGDWAIVRYLAGRSNVDK